MLVSHLSVPQEDETSTNTVDQEEEDSETFRKNSISRSPSQTVDPSSEWERDEKSPRGGVNM